MIIMCDEHFHNNQKIPLSTARYPILSTRRLQPPRDDCAVRVQWFSSMIMKCYVIIVNGLPTSIVRTTFPDRLDPDQARQNVGPDPDPISLTLRCYS